MSPRHSIHLLLPRPPSQISPATAAPPVTLFTTNWSRCLVCSTSCQAGDPNPGDAGWLRKDTEEFTVLGLGAHAAELLLVAAEAPGVVTLLVTQAAVPVQHLEGNVRVDLLVQSGTLQLCEAAGAEEEERETKGSFSGQKSPDGRPRCPAGPDRTEVKNSQQFASRLNSLINSEPNCLGRLWFVCL